MKQLILMVILTLAGTVGTFLVEPLWGVMVYYFFAIIRPNYLWEWSLPPNITWSYYVAIATILAAGGEVVGLQAGGTRPEVVTHAGKRWSAVHSSILLYIFWLSLSYFTAINREVAYPWLIENLKILIMFIVSSVLIRTSRDLWKLYLLATVAVGYIGYEVNIQYLETRVNRIALLGFGGYDNNGAGLLLAMGVPACFFAFEGSSWRARWAFLGIIPVLVHAVLLTFSRGAMVSLICCAPLMLLRSRFRGWTVPAVVVVGLTMVPAMAGPEVRSRFFSVKQYELDSSAQSRFASWKAAIGIANDHPFFGAGVRNSNLLSFQYGADREGRTIHNQYLQIAADTGYPGLALYLSVLVTGWLAVRRVRIATKGRQDTRGRQSLAIANGVECAMAVFCVGALFLSLETFELAYLCIFLGAQIAVVADSVVGESDLALRPA